MNLLIINNFNYADIADSYADSYEVHVYVCHTCKWRAV